MLATLTLPARYEHPELQRRPTVRVRSADELRTALRQARAQALTLDGTALDRVLRLDTKRGIVEVQAATPWASLAAYLAPYRISLDAFCRDRDLPASVGQAISQAAAGPDGLPVSAHVVSVTLVSPEGELRRADRDSNPGLLRLVLGGHGVIGVLYSVTLSVESLQRSAADAVAPVALDTGHATTGASTACTTECLLPPEALEDFLKTVRSLAEERRLTLHGVSVRRRQPDPSAFLNWATREWAAVRVSFGLKSTLGASVAAAEVRRALLDAALARGGSFPIHDLRDASRRQIEACYPKLGAFLAEKRRGDPAERLQNAWYRDLLAKICRDPCEVRWG